MSCNMGFLIYLIGVIIAFWMMYIANKYEPEISDRIPVSIAFVMSLYSWVFILFSIPYILKTYPEKIGINIISTPWKRFKTRVGKMYDNIDHSEFNKKFMGIKDKT